MRRTARGWIYASLAAILAGCGGASAGTAGGGGESSASLGTLPAVSVNAKKAELGKRLFFDRRLSGDAAISCADCHQPEKGFSDGLALSKLYPGTDGFRNTPTVINAVHKKSWFHDGRLGTNLNDVTRESITEDYFMNMDMRLMQERLKQDPLYVKMFKDAGYGEPSNGSVRKAIPEYLKSLTSRNAPFDTGKMSSAAKKGEALFTGKAGCVRCHNGSLASDGKMHNLGVPENQAIFNEPLRSVAFVAFNFFMGNENVMNLKRDVGAHVQHHYADGRNIGAFMTPSLRELTYTAPYMHNGMLKSLESVVAFYNAGGGKDANKDPMIRPLNLSSSEQSDLVAFLKSLSGDPLTTTAHVWDEDTSKAGFQKPPLTYTAIENWRNVPN